MECVTDGEVKERMIINRLGSTTIVHMLTCIHTHVTDARPHMQALRDHVISQISEDRLQPLAHKLGLPQEVIDQLPVGKQGFEVMMKEWLKSGQCKWHDLVTALRENDQPLSDTLMRLLQTDGMWMMGVKLYMENCLCRYIQNPLSLSQRVYVVTLWCLVLNCVYVEVVQQLRLQNI